MSEVEMLLSGRLAASTNQGENEPKGFASEADVLAYIIKHRERLEFMCRRYPLECVFPVVPPEVKPRVLHHIRIVLRDAEHLRRILEKNDITA